MAGLDGKNTQLTRGIYNKGMDLNDFSYEYDGRRYVDPNVALTEQNAFIDNLRNLQAQNNAEISQQTYNLGTQVPSSQGGLVGGGSYFKSRFQTPQTNQAIAELRTAAQAQALQQALQNELYKAKKAYYDAANKATSGGTNGFNEKPLVAQKDDGSGEQKGVSLKGREKEYYDTPTTVGDVWGAMTDPTAQWNKHVTSYLLGLNPASSIYAGLPWVVDALGHILGIQSK